MLTIKECKKILSKHRENYSDQQIESIIKLLTIFAEIDLNHLKQK